MNEYRKYKKKARLTYAITFLILALAVIWFHFIGKGVDRQLAYEEQNKPVATQTSENEINLTPAVVTRIIDGDTIAVDILSDNTDEEYTVRLIGVNTPESVHPDESKNTEAGSMASDYTKTFLPEGTKIWLQSDTSETDKYGRLLRYVWLSNKVDPNDEHDIENLMFNSLLLISGQAEPMKIEPDTHYAEIFDEIYAEYHK